MRYADVPLALQARRVLSVDAVRGFSIFWIIGADGAVIALERMLRGKGPVLNSVGGFLGTQITHADWEGFRFYDFIFPLFIFITGVSVVLALPRLVEREGSAKAHLHVLRRALLLYVLGIIYYGGVGQQLLREAPAFALLLQQDPEGGGGGGSVPGAAGDLRGGGGRGGQPGQRSSSLPGILLAQ